MSSHVLTQTYYWDIIHNTNTERGLLCPNNIKDTFFFVCVDSKVNSFIHAGTISCLPELNQYYTDYTVLCWTQHRVPGESRTSDPSTSSLPLNHHTLQMIYTGHIMCGSRGGIGGPDPPPPRENYKFYGFLYKLAFRSPCKKLDPLENVGSPLKPWKIIVFFEIKL